MVELWAWKIKVDNAVFLLNALNIFYFTLGSVNVYIGFCKTFGGPQEFGSFLGHNIGGWKWL